MSEQRPLAEILFELMKEARETPQHYSGVHPAACRALCDCADCRAVIEVKPYFQPRSL